MFTDIETAGLTTIIVDGDQVPSVLVERTVATSVDLFRKICGDVEFLDKDLTDFTHGMKIDGIISFVGDLTWSLILVLPHDSAELIANKFAGLEISYDSEDMGDVVGELTNVLAGVLCGELETVGIRSQMSVPTVTRGADFEQILSENLVTKKMYFVTNGLHFMIKLIVARHR
jgi:CheY-specific phosphatase CheX